MSFTPDRGTASVGLEDSPEMNAPSSNPGTATGGGTLDMDPWSPAMPAGAAVRRLQGDPAAPPGPLEPATAGLVPGDLLDIFFRPSAFFPRLVTSRSTPYLLLVIWSLGVADAIDRIDRLILQSEMGRPRAGWQIIAPFVTQSWVGFWAFCLAAGAISGALFYMVGGWWYRKRLQWSGDSAPDPSLARRVYIYASFVLAAPMILVALVQTALYGSYEAAWQAEEVYSLAILAFPFWSIGVSYTGVRSVFGVSPWKARIWFLILPALAYLLAFGVVAAAAALLAS